MAMAAAPPKQPSDAAQDSADKKTARDQARRRTGRSANTAKNGGWKLGPLSPAATVTVVTGAVGATATGLAFGLRDEEVSPQ